MSNEADDTTTRRKYGNPFGGGGPLNLGDPEDKSIRKVEKEVLIPKKMREKAKKEKCVEEVRKFHQCCLDHNLGLILKCRNENEVMKSCLLNWYSNEEFRKECEREYLDERTNYRRTGVKLKETKKYEP